MSVLNLRTNGAKGLHRVNSLSCLLQCYHLSVNCVQLLFQTHLGCAVKFVLVVLLQLRSDY
jgi:hypothetical protein